MQGDNYEHHCALIENYVHKYLPLQTHYQIHGFLSHLSDAAKLQQLHQYEKRVRSELNSVILADDGCANLADRLKEIRMQVS
jgi:hypothetical protein